MLDTNLTIEQIQDALARHYNFNVRQNIVVPNVSWGLLSYEADFVSVSKSGYMTEVEIKRSWSDFRKDFTKKHLHNDIRSSYFFYCVPKSIREKVEDALYIYEEKNGKRQIVGLNDGVPSNVGLITYDNHDHQGNVIDWVAIDFITMGGQRRWARKLTDREMLKLAHLGCMRVWDLKQKIAKLQQYDMFNQKDKRL